MSKKGKSPSFPLYASDLLTDTSDYTNEELGAYMRLLATQWVNGDLPEDQERLAITAKTSVENFMKLFATFSQKFHKKNNGRLVNIKLEKCRKEKNEFIKNAVKSGKLGAYNRWHKDSKPHSEPHTKPYSETMPLHLHSSISNIILYLNEKSKKNFKAKGKKTETVIKARLSEGFTEADCKKVIEIKTSEWLNDPKMDKFLRPETLFGEKFEGYLNQAPGSVKRQTSNAQGGGIV